MSETGTALAPATPSQSNGHQASPLLHSTAELRASILTTTSADDPNSDVMLDPQVDIRRHLSPSFPSAVPLRQAASTDIAAVNEGEEDYHSAKMTATLLSRRAKSFPRLHPTRTHLEQ